MWTRTDDPARDYEDYDRELHKDDHLFPECEFCKEHVLEDEEYVVIDGMVMHYECAGDWLFKQRKVMRKTVWQELLG